VRDLSGVFAGKANEVRPRGSSVRRLCEIWAKQVNKAAGVARLDGLDGLARTTLDIMGLAGFVHELNALSRSAGSRSALASAFDVVFATSQLSVEMVLGMIIPGFRRLPRTWNRRIVEARCTTGGIGLLLLQERKVVVVCVALMPDCSCARC
jgi:hypothetical protein